jgi:hypothetical protein
MKMKIIALVPAVLAAAVLLLAAPASAVPGNIGFGFNATDISGFPTGAATLTGGGSYNPGTGFVHSAGGFRCTSDVGQGEADMRDIRIGTRSGTRVSFCARTVAKAS